MSQAPGFPTAGGKGVSSGGSGGGGSLPSAPPTAPTALEALEAIDNLEGHEAVRALKDPAKAALRWPALDAREVIAALEARVAEWHYEEEILRITRAPVRGADEDCDDEDWDSGYADVEEYYEEERREKQARNAERVKKQKRPQGGGGGGDDY